MAKEIQISLPEKIGAGYGKFWRTKKTYVVCKGGKGSKKSTTAAQWVIYNMMKYPNSNTLIVRSVFNTHKDSTFALLKWAAKNLECLNEWHFTINPLEATYLPTGQKILFRGFDEPERLGSITVSKGVLCFIWMEEAFEIDDNIGFDLLDKSIRGKFEEFGVWKRIMITFNPWKYDHWIKKKYFDVEREDTDTFTTDHRCNEFLSEADHKMYEDSLIEDPERGAVMARGEWGIPGGAFFNEFRKDVHVYDSHVLPGGWNDWRTYCSIDYGFDMLAVLWYKVSPQQVVYAYKELHEKDLTISKAAEKFLKLNGEDKPFMIYAPPDVIDTRQKETGTTAAMLWQENGVMLARSSNKREMGWMSVKEALKPYKTIDVFTGDEITTAKLQIFSCCKYLIEYLPQVQHDDKNYNDVSDKPHLLTHIVDSLRYFCVQRYFPNASTQQQTTNYIDNFEGKLQNSTEATYINW